LIIVVVLPKRILLRLEQPNVANEPRTGTSQRRAGSIRVLGGHSLAFGLYEKNLPSVTGIEQLATPSSPICFEQLVPALRKVVIEAITHSVARSHPGCTKCVD
jgi:hypothetical protein